MEANVSITSQPPYLDIRLVDMTGVEPAQVFLEKTILPLNYMSDLSTKIT